MSNCVGMATPVVSQSCYTGNIGGIWLRAGRRSNGIEKGVHVGLRGVEGGHPADHAVPLIPDVERPVLLESRYVAGMEPGEDGVGLDGMDDIDAVDAGRAFGEKPGQGVGMSGIEA